MFAIFGHLFFSLDSQFALLRFSFLSDQYSQAISNVFSLLMQNSFSPKTKKKEKKNGAMTSVSFDLPKINSVPSLCLSSYSPNRIYHTYMTLPKEFGSWCLDNVIEFREFLLNVDLPTFSIACQDFSPFFGGNCSKSSKKQSRQKETRRGI